MKLLLRLRGAAFCIAATLPMAVLARTGLPGVANFQKLNDHVYRGAQPTDEGFRNLAKLGIHTIVNLREAGGRSQNEMKIVSAVGMHYINVPMKGMQAPSNESIAKVLALLEDTASGPVFVHCQRGADRTGGVIACYRIEHDHWQPERALSEARSLGMSWYQWAIQEFVRNYQPKIIHAAAPKALEAGAPLASTSTLATSPTSGALQ